MATDLRDLWRQYQMGRVGADQIRDATSMDEWDEALFADTGDTGQNHRRVAEELARRGIIRPEDVDKAVDEISRTGAFLYQPGQVRTFDGAYVDTHHVDDIASRAANDRASDLGHALPDSTLLSQMGWQNVTQGMREQFRDQGYIPQAPPSEQWAQTGNPPEAMPPGYNGSGPTGAGGTAAGAVNGGTLQGYQPFTEQFAWDPNAFRGSDAYNVTLADMVKASDRSAAAKGTLFTNQAREDLVRRAGDLATTYMDADFDRSLAGYQARAGVHDMNETGRFGSQRAIVNDDRAWDSTLWGRADADRRFSADRQDTLWSQNRTDQNDQWSRGLDTWNMNRTDRNDQFDQQYRLSDLVVRNRPRPL